MLDLQSVGKIGLNIDIKMMLDLLGKQSGACRHSCPYCECMAPWTCYCPANTLGSLQDHHARFILTGGRPQNAKNHQNCIRPALLSGPPELPVMKLIHFPELHVMTGVTGKLVNELIDKFSSKEKGRKWVEEFMDDNNISWCAYRPSTFEGNQARKFLRLSSKLRQKARNLPLLDAVPVLQFCHTLVVFNQVVVSCFGQELHSDYRTAIQSFSDNYRVLDISITPKVHLVERHAVEFIELMGGEAGLGKWSEQPFESVHADFKKEWARTLVSANHVNYAENLFAAVLRYNAKHVR